MRDGKVYYTPSEIPQKDFSNKAVLVMLVTVIVITVVSLILYLNVLSKVESSVSGVPQASLQIQQVPPSNPSSQGVVGLTILARENTVGGNP